MAKKNILLIMFSLEDWFVPLALGYIKAYALKDSFIKDEIDIRISNLIQATSDPRDALFGAMQHNAQILGFSCYEWNIGFSYESCKLIKQKLPETITMLGGPEVSYDCEAILAKHPDVDIVVFGEGEQTFQKTVKALCQNESLENVPGIAYRHGDTILKNRPRPLIESLDDIPSPYLNGIFAEYDRVFLETHRGCCFTCTFCCDGHRQIRYFSHERIEAEIAHAAEHGKIIDLIADSNVNIDKQRTRQLYRLFRKYEKLNNRAMLTGTIEANPNLIDTDLVEDLRQLRNRLRLEFGIQSTHPDTLKNIQKTIDYEKFEKGLKLLKESGNEIIMDVIIGLPGDNFFTFLNSLMYCIKYADRIEAGRLVALKGTKIWDRDREKFGIWCQNEEHSSFALENDSFPFQEIQKAYVCSKSIKKEHELHF